MAHSAFLLAVLLPFLVAVAHIIGTAQLPVSSSLSRQLSTASSPRHQPPDTRALSSSYFEVHHQTVSPFLEDGQKLPEPKLVPEPQLMPEPAVVEELIKSGSEAKGNSERLDHLAKVLQLFGYTSMAVAAPLLNDSWILGLWSGPVTVFAVPDAALIYDCPGCPLRLLMLKHMAFGAYSFSKLSSQPSFRLITPVIKFCLSSTTTLILSPDGPLTKIVSINSVKIIIPQLYNDSRIIIHGMKRYIELPPHGSCT